MHRRGQPTVTAELAARFAAGIMTLAATTVTVAARDATLQSACFAPEALQALPGEKPPVKGLHDFDKTPPPDATLAPSSAIPAAQRGAIRRVTLPAGQKLIALTFDLCEQRGEIAGYDGELFGTLRRHGVQATLFTGGKWMRSHAARTEQLMSDPLFEIANHGEFHRNLRLLDTESIRTEITAPQHAYERARRRLATTQCAASVPDSMTDIPKRMALFRFPFGACNAESLTAVNDAGLLAIQWDISAGDPDPHQSAIAIARTMVANAKPGSIIVAHGNGRGYNTAAALAIAIPKLKAMGYLFVTVSELLARGTPVISDSCYDSRPGDTNRYDFLAGAKPKPAGQGALEPTSALPWTTSTKRQSQRDPNGAPKTAPEKTQPNVWPF